MNKRKRAGKSRSLKRTVAALLAPRHPDQYTLIGVLGSLDDILTCELWLRIAPTDTPNPLDQARWDIETELEVWT
jgi:hypothetical protein